MKKDEDASSGGDVSDESSGCSLGRAGGDRPPVQTGNPGTRWRTTRQGHPKKSDDKKTLFVSRKPGREGGNSDGGTGGSSGGNSGGSSGGSSTGGGKPATTGNPGTRSGGSSGETKSGSRRGSD